MPKSVLRQASDHHRQILLVSTLLFFIFFFICGGCQENPVGIGSLIDPNTPLVVVSTYPSNGSVGPYNNLYDNISGNYHPHFMIAFSKYLDQDSLDIHNIHAQGFDIPVVVSPSMDYFNHNILNCYIYDTTQYYPHIVKYKIGKTYTISLDTTIFDITGRHLVSRYSFSYTPVPFFRVGTFSPRDGDSFIEVSWIPTVTFNSNVRNNIFSYLSIAPPLGGSWSISSDSSIVTFSPTTSLRFNTNYTIAVDGGAPDAEGNRLQKKYISGFSTCSFTIWNYIPGNGSKFVGLNSSISFYFNGPIDTSTIRQSISIQPPVSGYILYYSPYYYGKSFTFKPSIELDENTTYITTISTQLRAAEGTPLNSVYHHSFTTDIFRVTYTEPSDHGIYQSLYGPIRILFSANIDTTSIKSAFSSDPPIDGTFVFNPNFYPGYSIDFRPRTYLPFNQTYTITISTEAQSIGGKHLHNPYTFSFTTM